ncbi:MAG: DUF86 domain-containing protein [Clostridiales Family XIII bacterium]|jgi:uncharacterized protein with HEPN domain|nr:DUF86 domain-containing protein [Clostridiales Family XIII bacterium]
MKVSPSQRNITILKKIVEYCDQIDEAVKAFGKSKDALEASSVYRNASAMCILQIGELTTHLTTEFKAGFTMIPWQKIKDMRNVAAHHYGRFDDDILWETITEDIAPLRDYCNECIATLEKEKSKKDDSNT